MVNYNAIRNAFETKLVNKPRGLNMDEFNQVISVILKHIESSDQRAFTRLDYWLQQSDLDAKIVCSNIELVRFNVIGARPPQKSKNMKTAGGKNSEGYIPPSLPREDQQSGEINWDRYDGPSLPHRDQQSEGKNSDSYKSLSLPQSFNVDRVLNSTFARPIDIYRLPTTVEARARLIDKWVDETINNQVATTVPPEDISPDTNNGNNRPHAMKYISVRELVDCIACSRNASALRTYAMHLMACFRIYQEELNKAKDRALDQKDDKIYELIEKVDNLTQMNTDQSSQIAKLLGFAENTKDQLDEVRSELHFANEKIDELHTKFDESFDFAAELGRMSLHMWIGSNVFKTQLDHLIQGRTLSYALKHLKVMYIICFHEVGSSRMVLYFCCTNFANVHDRIRKLTERHAGMRMFKPEAVCLISHEINNERAKLEQLVFANDDVTYIPRRKCFELSLTTSGVEQVIDKFNKIVMSVRAENFQGYQMRRDNAAVREDMKIDPSILAHITMTDHQFFKDTLPLCQTFIDCYVEEIENTPWHVCANASTRRVHRQDFGIALNNPEYELFKLNAILEERGTASTFDDMVNNGIIDKSNTKGLLRTSKVIADNEHIKLNAEMQQKLDDITPHLISDNE